LFPVARAAHFSTSHPDKPSATLGFAIQLRADNAREGLSNRTRPEAAPSRVVRLEDDGDLRIWRWDPSENLRPMTPPATISRFL